MPAITLFQIISLRLTSFFFASTLSCSCKHAQMPVINIKINTIRIELSTISVITFQMWVSAKLNWKSVEMRFIIIIIDVNPIFDRLFSEIRWLNFYIFCVDISLVLFEISCSNISDCISIQFHVLHLLNRSSLKIEMKWLENNWIRPNTNQVEYVGKIRWNIRIDVLVVL